ncbi:MAG: low molecular weight protein arginine phosphatase [Clostridia bacterium]|nr:low molecular weight protein arginine phosphatase [Clostridia bacterium]
MSLDKKVKPKINILFVCSGNTCRSPMAERIFAAYCKGKRCPYKPIVKSAGLFANDGDPMTSQAIDVLGLLGIDSSTPHQAKLLTVDVLQNADIIVCMTEGIKQQLLMSRSYEYASSDLKTRLVGCVKELTGEDVPDPYGRGLEAYGETARALTKMCQPLFEIMISFGDKNKSFLL